MKATIDFDDQLYRRLKVEAARRGRTIRDLVDEGVRSVLGIAGKGEAETGAPADDWYAALHAYAKNAKSAHDLPAMRASIAKGRAKTS